MSRDKCPLLWWLKKQEKSSLSLFLSSRTLHLLLDFIPGCLKFLSLCCGRVVVVGRCDKRERMDIIAAGRFSAGLLSNNDTPYAVYARTPVKS
ncbi:hypothetical protein CDAR_40361 [Caerostris darwini]|uniref:Uncharacterized protein n=1 Tax=Caerostris darwini TaxID=1538125 RepID=A0AAV4R7A6_9ARAC|nr:hypothetical protein CDAR_40361 [Caerostris darwini]